MKKTALLFLLTFCLNGLYAQLFSNQSEYFIKLTNGKALSFFSASRPTIENQKGVTNQTVVKTPNSFSNLKSITSTKADSLIFESINEADRKQVWIIEFFTPVSNIGTGTNNLNIAFNYTDATAYFMIRNKENGKYITWSKDVRNNSGVFINLSPLLQAGKDTKQHWAINTVDPAMREKAQLFLGRTSVFGFAPRFSTTDAGREYLTLAVAGNNRSGVTLIPEYNSLLYNRSFNIEPAIKAEKIDLSEIETFCPKILLSGDRDFVTGTQRDIFNRIIEENRKMAIYIRTELAISDSKTEIWAKVYFKAEELGGDRTATEGNWQFKVYQTIQGRTLKEIVSPSGAYNSFESSMNEKAFKIDQKNTSDIINYYTIIGDTMGDDVSTDDDCGDDTRVERIKFNPIYVVFNN
ncbi:MAG: hypothetical protein LH615_14345 [Ferruginibacter sp.]|nr:hypothetical protein [Ferruginibacter sp.]